MAELGHDAFIVPTTHLPPRELWLYDPTAEKELLPTPLDERGLVDMIGLIALMKSTVAPGYEWDSSFTDVHHLQWPGRWYGSVEVPELSPHSFRNLAISKVRVPRVFHNWVHRTTEPPILPSEEVMHYRIDAQRVAISLFQQVRSSKTAARKRGLDEAGLEQLLIRRFNTFSAVFEEAKQAPREFQLLDYSQYELRDIDDMVRIGTKLGKFAITESATNRVRRPIAAA